MSSSSDGDEGDELPAIVIDNGSSVCRGGFAGDNIPNAFFTSVIGHRRQITSGECKFYVGNGAQQRRDILNLNYPIEHGM